MTVTQNATSLLKEVWRHISRRRRAQAALILCLMLVVSVAEMVSIGAVVPLLTVLATPEHLSSSQIGRLLSIFFEVTATTNLILLVSIIFIVLTLLSACLRLILLWAQTKLGYAIGAECSAEIYRRTLYQPYEVHLERNSSDLISSITSKVNNIISNALNPVFVLISSGLILLAIGSTLMYIAPLVTIVVFSFFGLIYGVVIFFTRKTLVDNGLKVSVEQTLVVKAVQEGLGGIRDIILDGSQATFATLYARADLRLRRAQANIFVIGNCPRFIVEAFGIILLVTVAYWLTTRAEGFGSAIPTLGVIALSAQRLLPLLQNAYASWTSIQGGLGSLADALALLNQPLPANISDPAKSIAFNKSIVLENIYFRYRSSTAWILQDLSLTIPKGGRIGIIGPTGGGKSTALDLVMGLLSPMRGNILVDGLSIDHDLRRDWQSLIAHVPQSIFLADVTIAENIAFGIPSALIDYERVRQASLQAELDRTIRSWPKQYDTVVGERGVRLSGGQRQRIGIARALYKRADLIVFDEATSALDQATEESIIQAINNLPRTVTILTVAHRLTTLRHSDLIIQISDGKCVAQGSYADLVEISKPN
jgi:ATP-binding cassette, subfamily B, bacterial PglK